jgi:hypothetical protein
MPLKIRIIWHKDYFELKTLEKQPVQEEHSDLFLLLLKADSTSYRRCPLCTGEKHYFYHQG